MSAPAEFQNVFAPYLAAIEAALGRSLPVVAPPVAALYGAMHHGVFPGGKRIRPLLVVAVTEALGGDWHAALPSATALELLHCYTLIHDDLPCMDNDTLRRGRPTCHVQYGEATALLAGDALLTLAFGEAAKGLHAPARVVQLLSEAAGAQGVIGGQAADLSAVGQAAVSEDMLTYIHTNKTAALFRCAALMGLCAAGKSDDGELSCVLARFGLSLGLAFQYVDDLLDGGEEGAFSSVGVLGEAEVRARARHYTLDALACMDRFGAAGEPLRVLTRVMLEREA